MTDAIAVALEDLRKQRKSLDERLATIDEAIATLARMSRPAKPAATKPRKRKKAAAREPTPAMLDIGGRRFPDLSDDPAIAGSASSPTTKRRIQWKRRPWFAEWRAELLEVALKHPRGSAERRRELRAIVGALHTLPDGTVVRIPSSVLFAWVAELEAGEPHKPGRPVEPPREPRDFAGALDETKHDDAPQLGDWRDEIIREVLELPEGEHEKAIEELAQQRHLFPDGSRRRVGRKRLRAWVAEAMGHGEQTERRRLQLEGAIGNPLELSEGYDGDQRRRPECPAYARCLDFAVRRKWDAFTCDGCAGPGQQKRGPGAIHRGDS